MALALAGVGLLLLPAQSGRSTGHVDLVLVLALDVSSSVDAREFDLQKTGLATAFRHPLVHKAIARGRAQRIAVVAVQWAGYRQQVVSLAWRVIGTPVEAGQFADQIDMMPRAFSDGATHLGGVIEFGTALALAAPFSAIRRVIDISGDGTDNIGGPPEDARAAAIGAGITINGLAIANDVPDLATYFRQSVIGGPGAFVLTARTYDDYPRAILQKLVREIETQLII